MLCSSTILIQEKSVAEPGSVSDGSSQATTSSTSSGPPEFPNKNTNRQVAVVSTLAALALFLSARLQFGVSLKDLSVAALPYEEVRSICHSLFTLSSMIENLDKYIPSNNNIDVLSTNEPFQ